MLIFNRKGLREGMDDGAIPGTLLAFSPNGWIDTELFGLNSFHFIHQEGQERFLYHLLVLVIAVSLLMLPFQTCLCQKTLV